jgi:hypothetical protein
LNVQAAGGKSSCIALGPEGVPRILHVDGQNRLLLSSPQGTGWVTEVVSGSDPVVSTFDSHSLAVDSRGRAHVVYQVSTTTVQSPLVLRYAIQNEPTIGVEGRSPAGPQPLITVVPDPLRKGADFTLRLSGMPAGPARIHLVDVAGRIVVEQGMQVPSGGELQLNLRLPGIQPGVYFMRVRSAAHTATRRVIILP